MNSIQIISLPASTTVMYSASVVDNATVFCNLDCHETTPHAYVITYPDVEQLVSTWVDMSELVKASSKGLLEPNHRHTLEVPFRYQSIHLTDAKCSLPGLLMNLLTISTTYSISGLVHTTVYIRLLTVEAYGISLISTLSAFVFGHCFPNSLLLVNCVEPIDLEFSMLNL